MESPSGATSRRAIARLRDRSARHVHRRPYTVRDQDPSRAHRRRRPRRRRRADGRGSPACRQARGPAWSPSARLRFGSRWYRAQTRDASSPSAPGTTRIGRSGAPISSSLTRTSPESMPVIDGTPDGMTLHDCGSTNGSLVERQPVPAGGRQHRHGEPGRPRLQPDADPRQPSRPAAVTRGPRRREAGQPQPPSGPPRGQPSTLTLPAPPHDSRATHAVGDDAGADARRRDPGGVVLAGDAGLHPHEPTPDGRQRGVRPHPADAGMPRRRPSTPAPGARGGLPQPRPSGGTPPPLGPVPTCAEILAVATVPSTRLWERRRADPDVLQIRVGTWTAPTQLADRRTRRRWLHGGSRGSRVPCPVSLGEAGVLGDLRVPDRRQGLARLVVGQIAVLHSPRDVDMWVIAADPRNALGGNGSPGCHTTAPACPPA